VSFSAVIRKMTPSMQVTPVMVL